MSKQPKAVVYNDNDRAVVDALRGTEGLTLAEINEKTGLELKPGHIVSIMKKGLIAAIGEKEGQRPTVRKVSTYSYVDSDQHELNGKPANYTENETNVLSYASRMDGEFTLAELAAAMGLEKLSSGSINGLVKKGNIVKGAGRDVQGFTPTSHKIYGFVKDIPADAE